jgi:putative two-component system response regulator
MARNIAATHHERWDGTGYPHGLRGEDIPLCGRIVALADAYDALTSKRVYKGAFSHDIARSIIVESSGSHFDPSLVEAFLACERQFIEVHQRYAAATPSQPAEAQELATVS